MVNVRKAAVQFLLALFVLNTTVCTCAGENVKDTHAHHQSAEAGSGSECHDGACLGSCGQAVAAKSDSVAAPAPVVRLELEPAFLGPVELSVVKAPEFTKISRLAVHQYCVRTDTPVTRKDRLLA